LTSWGLYLIDRQIWLQTLDGQYFNFGNEIMKASSRSNYFDISLEEFLYSSIPVVKSLQLAVNESDDSIEFTIPLEPNINHAGSIFGGSLASLSALAGFGAIISRVKKLGINARVLIVENSNRYRRPADSTASCQITSEVLDNIEKEVAAINEGSRGRITLELTITAGDTQAVKSTGVYVVIRD
jgi:thioesterase domain-containing protein